ncbi:MAG TPA: CPBP family intramembrane glutamic endopeptidase, partial [Actinomycetota bacterium]|nr:CPBP family intramembrane glutamic endopeptidase [Actinomycetota bacterium]
MSARADAVRPFAARPAVPVAATAGLGILLLVGRQLTASPPTLLLVLIAVGALSVWPTVRALDPPALRTGVAIGVGVALVAVAAGVQGPRIPAPTVAWVLPLGLVAAVAEEALFRRLIYGGLRRWGVAVAIIGSAVLFAALHV